MISIRQCPKPRHPIRLNFYVPAVDLVTLILVLTMQNEIFRFQKTRGVHTRLVTKLTSLRRQRIWRHPHLFRLRKMNRLLSFSETRDIV